MMADRGITLAHSTILRWVQRYPSIAGAKVDLVGFA
jgi:transposase-like protein